MRKLYKIELATYTEFRAKYKYYTSLLKDHVVLLTRPSTQKNVALMSMDRYNELTQKENELDEIKRAKQTVRE